MAPSAISTPTGDQESHFQQSSGILNLNGLLDTLRISSPANGRLSNGYANGHTNQSARPSSSQDEVLDLLCVGFGPSSLAIAIALHDSQKGSSSPPPKVLFLEKQSHFAWHAGMQLPGAKMQISFLKDLATPRDPTSHFTFLNYLFSQGRLNTFINLGTFLPSRVEYEDYLRWCAGHFERDGRVAYGMEVNGVRIGEKSADGKVTSFSVTARDSNGDQVTRKARHVVIAVGGQPVIPNNLQGLKHVTHSSQYANTIGKIQENGAGKRLKFAVVGGGQSAAEIFNDLWERFPDAEVNLVIKGASLRPSDDSPFVNEVFDPERVDGIYAKSPDTRSAAITLDRATNYGVVRLELLEHLYEKLYMQRLRNNDTSKWRCRILNHRAVVSGSQSASSGVLLKLGNTDGNASRQEELEVDYVFTATGYARNAHESMLGEVKHLLPESVDKEGRLPVARDYRVQYDDEKVGDEAGVWLQGCNEATHGLSDTLLSILSIRGGELVESIFGGPHH